MATWYVTPDGVVRPYLNTPEVRSSRNGFSQPAAPNENEKPSGPKSGWPLIAYFGVCLFVLVMVGWAGRDSGIKVQRTGPFLRLDEAAMKSEKSRRNLPKTWSQLRSSLLVLERDPDRFGWLNPGFTSAQEEMTLASFNLGTDDAELAGMITELTSILNEMSRRQQEYSQDRFAIAIRTTRNWTAPPDHDDAVRDMIDPSAKEIGRLAELRRDLDRHITNRYGDR